MDSEKSARISLIAAELNAETVASFAEVQGMMVANAKRRRDNHADAYGEEAFNKIRGLSYIVLKLLYRTYA